MHPLSSGRGSKSFQLEVGRCLQVYIPYSQKSFLTGHLTDVPMEMGCRPTQVPLCTIQSRGK